MEGGDAVGKRRASGEGLLRWRKDRKHWEGRITIGTNEKGNPIFGLMRFRLKSLLFA